METKCVTCLSTIHTHTKNPNPNPQIKRNPQPPSDLKLSARVASQSGQSEEEVTARAREEASSQTLLSPWPVLSKKVWVASSTTERIKFRKHSAQVLQRNPLQRNGCRAEEPGGQESTYKNALKIRVKIVLRFNTPMSSLLTRLLHSSEAAQGGSQEGATPACASPPPPFRPKKHYSIFTSKSWLVWLVSLEPSMKEATFSCYVYLSTYQSGYFF